MTSDAMGDAAPPPERVPTLTEVIDPAGDVDHALTDRTSKPFVNDRLPISVGAWVQQPSARAVDALGHALDAAAASVDTDRDARLREALQPLIVQFTDSLIAAVRTGLRAELASGLRDVAGSQTAGHSASPNDPTGADRSSA